MIIKVRDGTEESRPRTNRVEVENNRAKVEGTKANPGVILDEKLIDYMGESLTEVTK